MLKYIISDIQGRVTELKAPLKVSFVSSENAPADQLSAVFAVSGRVGELYSAEVLDGNERIFYGLIDSISEEQDKSGVLLSISARSLEAVLLDNEACPCTYCMPSMPLLMKKHFRPLGFESFIGNDRAFNGELVISKGMSEWAVLKSFCEDFLGTEPVLDRSGVIDVSGVKNPETLRLSRDKIISLKKTRNKCRLISDVHIRTYSGGDYELPLKNGRAESLGIKRVRYIDVTGSSGKTVLSVKKMIEKANRGYETVTAECAGRYICRPAAKLVIDGSGQDYTVREISYRLDSDGEKTTIYAEAEENEDI